MVKVARAVLTSFCSFPQVKVQDMYYKNVVVRNFESDLTTGSKSNIYYSDGFSSGSPVLSIMFSLITYKHTWADGSLNPHGQKKPSTLHGSFWTQPWGEEKGP